MQVRVKCFSSAWKKLRMSTSTHLSGIWLHHTGGRHLKKKRTNIRNHKTHLKTNWSSCRYGGNVSLRRWRNRVSTSTKLNRIWLHPIGGGHLKKIRTKIRYHKTNLETNWSSCRWGENISLLPWRKPHACRPRCSSIELGWLHPTGGRHLRKTHVHQK